MRRFIALCTLLMACVVGAAAASAQTPPAVTIAVDLDPAAATGIRIEGLASDRAGMLYTIDLDSRRFFRIDPAAGTATVLGVLGRPGTGMAFNAAGDLFIASTDQVLRINAADLAASPFVTTSVQTFATGLTGANGLAFGARGELYVSGGATGNIYVVASDGITRTFASGFTSEREAQRISTNGLAFGLDGLLYSSNTGTGAIDRLAVNADGTAGPVERFATSPLLLGADGITFASNGDLYVAANERNAIVRVARDGAVSDVTSNGNTGPLEFPASPSFSGNALYVSNFDIERGANAPNTGGIGASIARIAVGLTGATLPFSQPVEGTVTPGTPSPAGTPAPAGTPVPVGTPVGEVTPTVAVSTPLPTTPVQPTPEATVEPLPTVAVFPTVEPVPTTIGMPRTGAGQEQGMLYLAAMLLGLLAVVMGLAARSPGRTQR